MTAGSFDTSVPASEVTGSARRMWILEQLDPGPGLHVQTSLRIAGPLTPSRVREALDELARRHAALRTRFRLTAAVVEAVVDEVVALPLQVEAAPGGEDDLRTIAVAASRRRFDLVNGPLCRALLVALGPDDHHLLLLTHHAVVDRWAARHLALELIELLCGRTPPPPLGRPAFVTDSRPNPSPVGREGSIAYWNERLGGAPLSLDLPTDQARPGRCRHLGTSAHATLDAASSTALSMVAREAGTTRFVAVLAGWAEVLRRFTGVADIVIGTHLAIRDTDDRTPVSCQMNTVPLRVDVSDHPSFRTLLGRTRDLVDGGMRHSALPFDVLVDQVGAPRDGTRNPIFQVDYSYWGTPEPSGTGGSLSVRSAPLDLDTAMVEVGLAAAVLPGGSLDLRVDLDVDLFAPPTARMLAGQVCNLLDEASQSPDRSLRHVVRIDAPERAAVLAWGGGPPLPAHRTVPELFAQQADIAPHAIAMRDGDQATTYSELHRRVTTAAAALRRRGVGPGVIIGISAHHPADWLVGYLAVMAAGGAFAPLDPALPAQRRGASVDMIGIGLVVLGSPDPEPWGAAATVALEDLTCRPAPHRPLDGSGAQTTDPAYAVLTSGSTGTPKAVMVTVGNLAASNAAHLARYPVPVGAMVCVHEPVFDAWIGMAMWALTSGGELVIPSDTLRRDPRHLAALVGDVEATHVVCLPTYWRAVLDHSPADQLATVRIVVIGAEPCPRGLGARHHEMLGPGARLHNEYGPTETTVWCTAHELEAGDERFPVPIGRPVAGARVYVVDADLALVAPGMRGELLVGGAGVAASYLGQRDLTARSFVDDPYLPGGRAYRTGDLVRWLPDGTLQFLGRHDDQLKLRGRRLALGDVEAALSASDRVRDAVAGVVAGAGTPQLVAWVTVTGSPDVGDVRETASALLPPWMVPVHLAVVDELPRTQNGKFDRAALVAGWRPPRRGRVDERAPSETEERLRALWIGVLEVDAVALTDDFFDVGGHSLLAVELFAAIDSSFGRDLPLSTLLDHPTVARLAAFLDQHRDPVWSNTVAIGSGPSRDRARSAVGDGARPLFCVHGAGGNVLRLRTVADVIAEHRPFHAIQSRGLDGRALPYSSIEEMAADYLLAVRRIAPEGPHLLAGFSLGGLVALEMARQCRGAALPPSLVVLIDSAPPGSPSASGRAGGRGRSGRGRGKRRAVRLARVAVDEARLRVGLRIPVERRPAYLLRAGRRLFRAYRPVGTYDGPVLLILHHDDPQVVHRWRTIVPHLEVAAVSATHHEGLLDEPNATHLAAAIEAFIGRTPWT